MPENKIFKSGEENNYYINLKLQQTKFNIYYIKDINLKIK